MFAQVLAAEFLKLRRSKVTWFSLAALSLGPLAIALMMWIVREPGRAAKLGLLGTKANLSGLTATWPAYSSMLTMVVGFGGMLLLAFVVAFVFGREYTEGTAKNLLALPVGRHWFALAKLVVAAIWWAALVAAVLVEGFALGALLRLPGFSPSLVRKSVQRERMLPDRCSTSVTRLFAPGSIRSPQRSNGTCASARSHCDFNSRKRCVTSASQRSPFMRARAPLTPRA